MPVKWTSETDQVLLLKILETTQVNADVKKISDAWPDNLERPTPRAITERLVKIRSTAREAGAAEHFSVSNGKSKAPGSTPRKRGPKTTPSSTSSGTSKKNGAAGNQGSGGKRKRDAVSEDSASAPDFNTVNNDTDATDSVSDTPTKKHKSSPATVNIKREIMGDIDDVHPDNHHVDDVKGVKLW